MFGGCEVQTNWYKVPNDKQFDRLVKGKDEDETIGEHNELMTSVPQQTERPMVIFAPLR